MFTRSGRDWGLTRQALTGPGGPAGQAARSAQTSNGPEKASTCSCAALGAVPPPSVSAPGIRAGSPGPAGQTAVPTAAAISPSPSAWSVPPPPLTGHTVLADHFLQHRKSPPSSSPVAAPTLHDKGLLIAPGSQDTAACLPGATSRICLSSPLGQHLLPLPGLTEIHLVLQDSV